MGPESVSGTLATTDQGGEFYRIAMQLSSGQEKLFSPPFSRWRRIYDAEPRRMNAKTQMERIGFGNMLWLPFYEQVLPGAIKDVIRCQ